MMGKSILIDAITGKQTIIDIEEPPQPEVTILPEIEERIKSTEEAILILLDMGMMRFV